MFSIQSSTSAPLNREESALIDFLPEEIFVIIFSFVPLSSLVSCSLVNRKWNRLTYEKKKIYEREVQKLAFGKDKWAYYFGVDIGEEPPLPSSFLKVPPPF